MDLVRPFQLIILNTSSLEEGPKKKSKHIYYQKHIRGNKPRSNEL